MKRKMALHGFQGAERDKRKTIPEWATEMVGYPSRFGPFRDCFGDLLGIHIEPFVLADIASKLG